MNELNEKIDYTLLDMEVSEIELRQMCEQAINLKVASVCVMPLHVPFAREILKSSAVSICSVISFPEGNHSMIEKVIETERAILDGADEIDMVLNYHLIENASYLKSEVEAVRICCSKFQNKFGKPILLKVIVESGILSLEQTRIATQICIDTQVDFIKTSTGKEAIGAELEKVQMMHETIRINKSNLKIKASGGIRTMEQVSIFLPYVQRFGMGYKAVDILNNF